MNVIRRREMILPGGGVAVLQLVDVGNGVIECATEIRTAKGAESGSGPRWHRCQVADCIGRRCDGHDKCFVHASEERRVAEVLRAVESGNGFLQLFGCSIDQSVVDCINTTSLVVGGRVACGIDLLCGEIATDIKIRDRTLAGTYSFTGARFPHSLGFERCTFLKQVSIRHADIAAHLQFWACQFDDSVNIDASGPPGGVATTTLIDFRGSTLKGELRAHGFCGHLSVHEAQLLNGLTATSTSGHLDLSDSELHHHLSVDGCELDSLVMQSTDVLTRWNDELVTCSTLHAHSARFRRHVSVVLDADQVDLSNANFESGGTLVAGGAALKLDRFTSDQQLLLSGTHSRRLVLRSAIESDLSNLVLENTDLRTTRFRTARNLDRVDIRNNVLFHSVSVRFSPRAVVADEADWRTEHGAGAVWRISPQDRDEFRVLERIKNNKITRKREQTLPADSLPGVRAADLVPLYRALRRSSEGRSDTPGASDFYYGEMEMRRLSETARPVERFILTLYWMAAGYGLRASRALTALLILLSLGGLGSYFLGPTGLRHNLLGAARFTLDSAMPGRRFDGAALNGSWYALSLILGVAGPVLAGLAALAVRNRIKR